MIRDAAGVEVGQCKSKDNVGSEYLCGRVTIKILKPTRGTPRKLEVEFESGRRLVNKPPYWNERLQRFCLQFDGRATMISIKNCMLVEQVFGPNVILFGKIGTDQFNLDHNPNPDQGVMVVEAVAFALAAFDSRM